MATIDETAMANAKTSYEVFAAYAALANITDEQMLREIYAAADPFFADQVSPGDILDLMAASNTAPESFKKYVADFNIIKQGNTGITTIAEWNQAKQLYRQLLQNVSPDLATDEFANQFLKNNVSVREATDRINAAYNAVVNADSALKEQLKTYYPSLKTSDIVRTMLGVGKTVDELQKQIGVAGIRAEAATAGLESKIGAEELFAQGIDRGAARAGFQRVAEGMPALGAAAARAGQTTEGLQQSLEEELVAGKTLASKRRKQLAAGEQASLAGRAGTTNISLGTSGAGAF